MFLMIYYICLFWVNEGVNQPYLKYCHYEILVKCDCVDKQLKINFIENLNNMYGNLDLNDKYEKLIVNILLKYNIDMDKINTEFYNIQGDHYKELS